MLRHQARFAPEWLRRGLWGTETLADTLAATATRLDHKTAMVDGERRMTFPALAAEARALATSLDALGLRAGDTVAYQLPNWTEAVAVVHAAAILGAVANPLLPAYGERETAFILGESGARALFVPGIFRGRDHRTLAASLRRELPDLVHVVVVRDEPGADALAYGALAGEPPPPAAGAAAVRTRAVRTAHTADAVALLVYTSGTTAEPKGVLHTHNTLLAEARSLREVHALTPADTVLMPSPVALISGIVHAVLVPAVIGTTAVLMDRWDAVRALALIDRERVTYMVGPPVFVQDLCRAVPHPPPSLRLFSCGGADVTPDVVCLAEERLGCVAKRVYGSTEFPTLTTTGPDDPPARRHRTEGRVIGAAELRIVDAAGRPCPPGGEGEIVARGPECCIGYRRPGLDAESFDADDWFRTGDLGVVDADGYLTVTGRKKDIIIRKGENISAREVEELLQAHPDVDEVAVVGVPDPTTGERACAVVRARPGTTPSLATLTEFLRQRGLSTRKLPERVVLVTDFPRTASGKIQKGALKERMAGERP